MFDKREPERTEISKELAALEQQLSALTPTAPRIDRDKLMFAAGQAAVSRPRWPGYIAGPSWAGSFFWPSATATMTAATLLLATMLVWQRQAMFVAEQAAKPQAAPIQTVDPARGLATYPAPRPKITTTGWLATRQPMSGYLGIRYIALTQGVGALAPDYTSARGSDNSQTDLRQSAPATARDLMEELLPTSARMANPRS